MKAVEYRVDFARVGWKHGRTRFFQRRHAMRAFVARLHEPHPDYAPFVAAVSVRPVGKWRPHKEAGSP